MKRNKSQSTKFRLNIGDLFFDKKPEIKNSFYYKKIYTLNTEKKKKNYSTNSFFLNKTLEPTLTQRPKSVSIKKMFYKQNKSKNIKIKWPKITYPIWPFTKKRTEPEELKKERILSSRPSHRYHDFNTIKWLGCKYTESVKEKSLYSLLTNNGKSIKNENEKDFNENKTKIKKYLDSLRGPLKKEKFVKINPKYFYDGLTFKKILKLKEMFLEFDKNGNHKMIIKQIIELFKQNNINVEVKELKNFFINFIKNKKEKNEKNNLSYIDFYQFLNLALSKGQEFRLFMRKIKNKNKTFDNIKSSKTMSYNDKKDNVYIPMNFSLIFNYFINKEKERNSVYKLENDLNEMDKIIQGINEIQNNNERFQLENRVKGKSKSRKILLNSKTIIDKKISFNFQKSQELSEEQNITRKSSEKDLHKRSTKNVITKINETIEKENIEKDKKLKKINFPKIIKEFSNLLNIKDLDDEENEFKIKNRVKSAQILNPQILNHNSYYYTDRNLNKNKESEEKVYEDNMKKEIRINSLKNINIDNYEKYHDIKLALKATKEQIKKMKNYKTSLIYEDLKTCNMVDIRDIFIQDIHKKSIINNLFSQRNKENKLNRVLTFKSNDYFSNRTFLSKNKNLDNFRNKKKKFHFKKPVFNYYCGKHTIINIEDTNISKRNKFKLKQDYVPNEFLTENK